MKRCVAGVITLILCAVVLFPALPLHAASSGPSGPLVISEIETGGCTVSVAAAACPGTSTNHLGEQEFIELHRTQAEPLTMHGWTLEYITASGGTTTALAALNGTIAGNGYLLAAHAGTSPDADLTFGSTGDGGKLAATGGYIALINDRDTIVDALGWGSGLSAAALAGWPLAPAPPYGESVSRILPGNPLYGTSQIFTEPSWQLSPQGGNYMPALPVDTIALPHPSQGTPAPSPLIITALRLNAGAPVFVQVYNNSDAALDLHDWKLVFDAHDAASETAVTLAAFSGWLAPHGYLVAGDSTIANADSMFSLSAAVRGQLAALPAADVTLLPSSGAGFPLDLTAMPPQAYGQWLQRLQSSSGKYTVTGTGSDFTVQNGAASLAAGGTYEPPETASGLEIIELLPHAPDCSPLYLTAVCTDYIKLFNPSASPIDLSLFRLRSDSGGLQPAPGNTIPLNGTLAPRAYRLVGNRADGEPLSLTDSGGYVWVEDVYGLRIYQPVVQYPSAADTAGWAWAFDGSSWRWSSHPSPDGANIFPPDTAASGSAAISLLKPCTPDQYRNPATNRCRSLVSATTAVQPCQQGQERNPATSRCRAVLAASTSLKPCAAGQTRNPATNRCRSITATTIASVSDAAAPAAARSNITPWILTALIAAAALAYAAYEWRQDILLRYGQLYTAYARIRTRIFRRNPGR